MDENGKTPWFNIWMVFVSTAGLWLTYQHIILTQQPRPMWINDIVAALASLLVGVIAVVRWPKPSCGEAVQGTKLDEISGVYASAWRTLWRQKWLLGMFGFVLGIRIIGVLIDTCVYLWARQGGSPNSPWDGTPWTVRLIASLSSGFVLGQGSILGDFTPRTGSSTHAPALVLFGLAILISLVWVRKYLRRLSTDPEYGRDAQSLLPFIAPVAIVTLAIVAGTSWDYVQTLSMFMHAHPVSLPVAYGGHGAPGIPTMHSQPDTLPHTFAGHRAVGVGLMRSLSGAILGGIIYGALISGLGVSLGRIKHGEQITKEAFARAAVRYFKPVAGIYLALMLVPDIFIAGHTGFLIKLLFIFAPYVVVFKDTGAWQALRQSAQVWFRNPSDTLAFFAAGYSIIAIVTTALYTAQRFIPPAMWPYVPYTIAYTVVSMILTAFMAIAVWEFYWRVSGAQADIPAAGEAE